MVVSKELSNTFTPDTSISDRCGERSLPFVAALHTLGRAWSPTAPFSFAETAENNTTPIVFYSPGFI